MSCYYIFKFHNTPVGDGLRYELSGTPNGTVFWTRGLIYINSTKDVWVMFLCSDYLDSISSSLEWIRSTGGAEVIKTDIVGLRTKSGSDPREEKFKSKIAKLFSKYAPHLCFD